MDMHIKREEECKGVKETENNRALHFIVHYMPLYAYVVNENCGGGACVCDNDEIKQITNNNNTSKEIGKQERTFRMQQPGE